MPEPHCLVLCPQTFELFSQLAIGNDVAVKLAYNLSSCSRFQFFWEYTQKGIAGSDGNHVLNLLRVIFSMVVTPFYITVSSARGFLFHPSLPTQATFSLLLLFNDNHPNGCAVVSDFPF